MEKRVTTETVGWGVIRMVPWHVLGIYPTSIVAQIRCMEAGKGYEVHLGEGNEVEQRFVWDDPDDALDRS
jgi:hypothetical protein